MKNKIKNTKSILCEKCRHLQEEHERKRYGCHHFNEGIAYRVCQCRQFRKQKSIKSETNSKGENELDETPSPHSSIKTAPKGCGKWFKSFEQGRIGIDTECGYQYRRNTRRHLCPDCKKLNEQGSKNG